MCLPNLKRYPRFIGSPPMNIIEGIMKVDNGKAVLHAAGISILLPETVTAKLHAQKRQTHVIGIRPEHIELVEPGKGNLEIDINVVENIGAEYLYYALFQDFQLVVRTAVKSDSMRVGLKLVSDKIHVF